MTDSRLFLGPLDEVRVELGRAPGASLFPVLNEVLGGARQGVPRRWRDAVDSALPASADTLRPLFAPGRGWIPDLLALTGDVVHAAWRQLEPLWVRADALLGKETERVGSAVVSRNLDGVLTGLSPRVSYADGTLALPPCGRERFELGGRRLVLIPVVSGTAPSLYSLDQDDVVWFSYPVPGVGRLGSPTARAPREDGLVQLLGPVRAGVLRSVQPPATVSELAGLLHVGASTITYHCEQLKAAGLLQRERYGREVRQRLTGRGAELVDLLSRPAA
ncbi:winged helix-turn-helix domain-containing protein [Streptomyces sp. NBC_00414]|uniref:ArsR/SmtB family transcription factor n=1 Tax=Streptomyces sp. NBC_00414 TaxID=2975739 RepID=UPI002E241EA5